MSELVDTDTLLRVALDHPDVRATVAEAILVDTMPPESEFSGEVTITRPVELADYVHAIHAHIDNLDGLELADVTAEAVAAVLPTTEETA